MRIAAAVVLLAVAGWAQADGGSIPESGIELGPVEQVQVEGIGRIPYQRLFEVASEPGESLDAFALRVAPRLRNYTAAEGFEACGVIAADDAGRVGVVIGTSHGHTACANFPAKVPHGMVSTGQTIHSHAEARPYRANAMDLVVLGRGARLGRLYRSKEPEQFSGEDFQVPGYLVGQRAVWHQQGKSTVREVGRLGR